MIWLGIHVTANMTKISEYTDGEKEFIIAIHVSMKKTRYARKTEEVRHALHRTTCREKKSAKSCYLVTSPGALKTNLGI